MSAVSRLMYRLAGVVALLPDVVEEPTATMRHGETSLFAKPASNLPNARLLTLAPLIGAYVAAASVFVRPEALSR